MGGLEGGMAGLAYQAGLVLGPASSGGVPAIPDTANTTPAALGVQCLLKLVPWDRLYRNIGPCVLPLRGGAAGLGEGYSKLFLFKWSLVSLF